LTTTSPKNNSLQQIDLQDQVDQLRAELSYFKRDGLSGSLFALNYQLNKLNETILSADIKLDSNDKTFDRFWKIVTEIQKVHEAIDNLKNKLYPKTAEEIKDQRDLNVMEELTKKIN
jgi:hypothetical protein